MGQQSLIYDRPPIASLVNELIGKNGYYFIGPFDFQDQLYITGRPASKYIIVLPGMSQSQTIMNELISDISRNRPKVVVYSTEFQVYGSEPGKFLIDYLRKEYFTLESDGAPCNGIAATTKWFEYYDFERHVFFDAQKHDEIMQELWDKKLIKKIDPSEVKTIPRCIAATSAVE